MPEVIADTSALQYLHQTEHLHLLRRLYGTIVVPEGVAEELAEGRALAYPLPDPEDHQWIRIVPTPHRRTLLLAADLGKGEREVISLAAEMPESLAILDDKLARRMARHLGVRFTGTLGVLLRAKAAGHLEAIQPLVDRLDALGFRLDPATRAAVLALADEA